MREFTSAKQFYFFHIKNLHISYFVYPCKIRKHVEQTFSPITNSHPSVRNKINLEKQVFAHQCIVHSDKKLTCHTVDFWDE